MWREGFDSLGDESKRNPGPIGTYVVSIPATSLAGLGACPHVGAVGLVTTASDGGTAYTLHRCGSDGGTWASIECSTGQASSVAYVPGTPGTLTHTLVRWRERGSSA
jgi:hypothetical protein